MRNQLLGPRERQRRQTAKRALRVKEGLCERCGGRREWNTPNKRLCVRHALDAKRRQRRAWHGSHPEAATYGELTSEKARGRRTLRALKSALVKNEQRAKTMRARIASFEAALRLQEVPGVLMVPERAVESMKDTAPIEVSEADLRDATAWVRAWREHGRL